MKTLVTLIGLMLLATVASAQSTNRSFTVTLAWDKNPEPDVDRYTIYQRTTGTSYVPVVTVTNVTTATLPGLQPGVTYFWCATAKNTSGLESDRSNEVSAAVPAIPTAPARLRLASEIVIQIRVP